MDQLNSERASAFAYVPLDDVSLRSEAAAISCLFSSSDVEAWEEECRYPDELVRALGERGLAGLTIPAAYGGRGVAPAQGNSFLEEFAYHFGAVASLAQLALNGPPRAIAAIGSEWQKQQYLPRASRGEMQFAIAMTERDSGSAATRMQTTLTPVANGYHLSGSKCYITAALNANALLVFGRVPMSKGVRGIGAVIVHRDQEGVFFEDMPEKMGGNALAESIVHFRNVEVEARDVLVPPDVDSVAGLDTMIRQFNPERCGNAAICNGIARRALDLSLSHASAPRFGSRRIIDFSGMQATLVDMSIRVDASRALTLRASASDDLGFPETQITMAAKIYANLVSESVCRDAIQVHGHLGYTAALPLARLYQEARGYSIAGGTVEVSRNAIANGLLLGARGVPDEGRLPSLDEAIARGQSAFMDECLDAGEKFDLNRSKESLSPLGDMDTRDICLAASTRFAHGVECLKYAVASDSLGNMGQDFVWVVVDALVELYAARESLVRAVLAAEDESPLARDIALRAMYHISAAGLEVNEVAIAACEYLRLPAPDWLMEGFKVWFRWGGAPGIRSGISLNGRV